MVASPLLALSVAINVLQAERIRDLGDSEPIATKAVGRTVQNVRGKDANGAPVNIRLDDGRPTVLYHFSSTCAWCTWNRDNLRALADGAAGRYRVLAISMEQPPASVGPADEGPVQVLFGIDPDLITTLALGGTPHTVVVDGDGMVVYDWPGAYTDKLGRRVEETFGVVLPGLRRASASTP